MSLFRVEHSQKFKELPAIAPDFGNDWLSNAHEISLPDSVSYVPQTQVLVWLSLLGLILLVYGGWTLLRRHQALRYQRQALTELQSIGEKTHVGSHDAVARIPELLKQVAFSVWPRSELIVLDTHAWLNLWRATSTTAPPEVIAAIGYRSAEQLETLSAEQRAEILAWALHWISGHRDYRHRSIVELLAIASADVSTEREALS